MELNMKCKKCGAMLKLVPSYLNGWAYVCPNKCVQVKITYSDRTEPYIPKAEYGGENDE